LDPSVASRPPQGETLSYGSDTFCDLERIGVDEAAAAAFVLVAGGLGERLGYSGIKVALPTESATGTCYLQLYAESILALQARAHAAGGAACGPLPLAIMTSDDTHERTRALLAGHSYFGLQPSQVTLLKQAKVPCLADNEARMALDGKDAFSIQTKPHGHGDVHALLHSTGTAAAWLAAGKRWVVFFQDTNALVFKAIPAALGVSSRSRFDVNSLCVPRKAKEAIGAITRLTRADGSAMTVNVEYNQLDPLLRASGFPDGDANDASTGYSPFPGNINQLVFALGPYAAQLAATGGGVAEFVNPKYKDATKTAFKSSTRLECMMQDYAKTVPPETRVGFTVIKEVWVGYSPVKNSVADALAKVAAGCPPHSAAAGECDMYGTVCRSLRMAGASVADPTAVTFAGTPLELWPRVVLSPGTAATLVELKERVVKPTGAGVRVSARSCLVLRGDVILEELELDGTLVITAAPGATVRVRGLRVANAGWEWVPLTPEEEPTAPEELRIRGFKVVRHAAEERAFEAPGEHVLSA
jgi:UDP-sugar pyrophosphorylase